MTMTDDGGDDYDGLDFGPTFSELILNLASCQYDCLTSNKRNEMIDVICKSLEISSDRHIFATMEGTCKKI